MGKNCIPCVTKDITTGALRIGNFLYGTILWKRQHCLPCSGDKLCLPPKKKKNKEGYLAVEL